MTGSTAAAARKRQRVEKDDGEDRSKKPRGRPRVDEQKETAADVSIVITNSSCLSCCMYSAAVSLVTLLHTGQSCHHPIVSHIKCSNSECQRRRTQIRLAQRAYRQRKENTIKTLEDRVANLRATIDAMNKGFNALQHALVNSSLLQHSPDVNHQLQVTSQAFLSLSKAAEESPSGEDSDHSDQDGERRPSSDGVAAPAPANDSQATSRYVDIGLGYAQVVEDSYSSSNEPQNARMGLDTGRVDRTLSSEVYLPSNSNHTSLTPAVDEFSFLGANGDLMHTLVTASSQQPQAQVQERSYEIQQAMQTTYPMYLVDRLLDINTIESPRSYSHHENSFTRRLHRASLEKGFALLTVAHQRPAAYAKVFRLTMQYHSRESLMARRRCADGHYGESLEFDNNPFVHLGGAGTHFPAPKGWPYRIRAGPIRKRSDQPEFSIDPRIDIDVNSPEYAGEWFDAADVEGYLGSLGIPLDAQLHVTETEVVESSQLEQLLQAKGVIAASPTSPKSWTTDSNSTTHGDSPQQHAQPSNVIEDGASRLFPELLSYGTNSMEWAKQPSNWSTPVPDLDATPFSLDMPQATSMWDSIPSTNANANAMYDFFEPASDSMSSKARRKIMIDVGALVNGKSPQVLVQLTSDSIFNRHCHGWHLSRTRPGISTRNRRSSPCWFGHRSIVKAVCGSIRNISHTLRDNMMSM